MPVQCVQPIIYPSRICIPSQPTAPAAATYQISSQANPIYSLPSLLRSLPHSPPLTPTRQSSPSSSDTPSDASSPPSGTLAAANSASSGSNAPLSPYCTAADPRAGFPFVPAAAPPRFYSSLLDSAGLLTAASSVWRRRRRPQWMWA